MTTTCPAAAEENLLQRGSSWRLQRWHCIVSRSERLLGRLRMGPHREPGRAWHRVRPFGRSRRGLLRVDVICRPGIFLRSR